MNRSAKVAAVVAALIATSTAFGAEQPSAQQGFEELRNTVVNLLQGLVERGIISKEQAAQMVRDAQSKAVSDGEKAAAVAKAEEGAVRVPYVPQIVKDEIRRQVASDLNAEVTKNVIDAAQSEGWGTPSALPDWVKRMTWSGDIRVRGQYDQFASDNLPNSYVDFQRVNEAGGIGKAGVNAFLNTTEERQRMRARLRFGFESNLGNGWTMGARITTGNLKDPVSTNLTLGNMGVRYQTGFDLAWLQWVGNSRTGRQQFTVTGGRLRNPFANPTDLVFDNDLTFEGLAANYRFGLQRRDWSSRYAYVTAGAFPLQESELTRDKWLFGGQSGIDWKYEGGSRLRLAAGYYQYQNTAGRRNALDSTLLDYTAPTWLQKGNTLFDIRNDTDPNTNLFALAADYRLANVSAAFDWRVATDYKITLNGDFVRNVGYDAARVQARTGYKVPGRVNGYQGDIAFGSAVMNEAGAWRASVGYRYVQRDAVLDGFTDSDFHLGGTDAKGFTLGFDYSLNGRVMTRLRYLSANEIDGPPLGIDVVQLDVTASF